MHRLPYLLFITILSFLFISCDESPEDNVIPEDEDSENDSLTTVEDYLSSEDSYSLFLKFLKEDGEISAVLNDESKDITVFAVSNETVNNSMLELGIDSLNQLYLPTVQQIIRYHINVTSSLQREDFNANGVISTLQSESISFNENVNISSAGLDEQTEFIGEEILVGNGVIHEIESMMIPPSIYEEMEPSLNTIHFPVQYCKAYSQFKDALDASARFESESLIDLMQNPELDLTLFLPRNDSFESSQILNLDNSQKYFLVSNHILENRIRGSQLEGDFTGLSGVSFSIDSEGNIESPIADINYEVVISTFAAFTQYSNGIIHEIEGLITSPDIRFSSENAYNTLAADSRFSDFKDLIDNNPELVELLQTTGESTVFAPTNDAFDKFKTALGIEDLNNLNPDIINAIIEYHVSLQASYRRIIFNEDFSLGTVQGENIIFNASGNPATGGSNTDVQFADLPTLSSNGIIHPIESILLPPSIYEAISSVLGSLAQTIFISADFTFFAEAIIKADAYAESEGLNSLSEMLSDNSMDLTVFAPVNQVFEEAAITLDSFSGELWFAIIAEHITDGDLSRQDLANSLAQGSATITTLSGSNVQLSNTEFQGNSTIAVGGAPVVASDSEAQNGRVHAIAGIISSVNKYSTVLLGGQGNPGPGFYDALDNIRYTYSPAVENASSVDMAYYYSNGNNATLASIDSEGLQFAFDAVGLSIEGIFRPRNSTRFRVTNLAPEQFDAIFLNSVLENFASSENNTNTEATNLQVGSVVAFQLDPSRGNTLGLIKVVEISGNDSSSRTITIEVKVQVSSN